MPSLKKRLTDKYIAALKAPEGERTEIRDAVMPGLWLRVSPDTGHKSFSVMAEVNGTTSRITIGAFPKIKIKAARKEAEAVYKKLDDGIHPTEEKRAKREVARAAKEASGEQDNGTLKWAAELWLKEARTKKKRAWRARTKAEYTRLMKTDVLPTAGHLDRRRDVVAINRKLRALVEKKEKTGPVQANRIVGRLTTFDAWNQRRDKRLGLAPVTLMDGIEEPVAEEPSDRVLSPKELAAFWRASTALGHPFGPLFKLLALTWLRREAIRALEWTWIDFERRRIVFPHGGIMKMGREFIVHLSDPAIDILHKLPRIDGSPYVFPATRRAARKGKEPPKGHAAVSGISRATMKVRKLMVKELGKVEHWKLHHLRHTAATIAAEELKIAPQIVDKILAHETITGVSAVARIYLRSEWLEERAAALDAWARYIESLVEPEKAKSNVVAFGAAQ